MTPTNQSQSERRCLGCDQPVGAFHKPECEYAPYHATEAGYPPRLVNVLQALVPPIKTRP